MKSNRSWLIILLLYLLLGGLYASQTPAWQVPDEPAHYNYIRALATTHRFPIMEEGDYDQGYLSRLTAERFPPELPLDNVRYENHQPPLYYLLATPIFWLSNGALLPLRLFSLALSATGVLLIWLIARELAPHHPTLPWLAAGLVATLPQFLAITTGVNNDALLFPLLWLWLWLALRYLRGAPHPALLGGVLGALLLTKTTGYGALPLAALAIYLRGRREGHDRDGRWLLTQAVAIYAPALALGALWWGRNLAVYGWPDLLGLQRHDLVVRGQPLTADWIARDGLGPFLRAALHTTFQSFWGQFGWMGVVLDSRLYQGYLILTILLGWGALARLRRGPLPPKARDGLLLLGSSALLTLAMYLYYNLGFVQHQGRYLFPALPALALVGAGGWLTLGRRSLATGTAITLGAGALLIAALTWIAGDPALWPVALTLASAGAVAGYGWLPPRRQSFAAAALLAGLAALALLCLWGFIVPQLT